MSSANDRNLRGSAALRKVVAPDGGGGFSWLGNATAGFAHPYRDDVRRVGVYGRDPDAARRAVFGLGFASVLLGTGSRRAPTRGPLPREYFP